MYLRRALDLGFQSGVEVVAFVGGGGKSSALLRLGAELKESGVRSLLTTTTHLSHAQTLRFPRFAVEDDRPLDLKRLQTMLEREGVIGLFGSQSGERVSGITPAQLDGLAASAQTLGLEAILVEADGSRGRPIKAPARHEPALPHATTLLVPVVGMQGVGLALSEENVHRPEIVSRLLSAPIETPLTPDHIARLLLHPEGGRRALPASARYRPLLNQVESPPHLAAARLVARRLARSGVGTLLGHVGLPDRPPVAERWGPIAVCILAAGGSRRMGQPKQLLEWQGRALVTHAVRTAQAADVDQIYLVLGAHADEVEQRLRREMDRLNLPTILHNSAWAKGQSTSVTTALSALHESTQAALFLPVDQPLLPSVLLRQLVGRWRRGADRVCVRIGDQIRGAPALFHRQVWPRLQAIDGDRGARSLLRETGVETVPARSEWLTDVDSPADWAQLQQHIGVN